MCLKHRHSPPSWAGLACLGWLGWLGLAWLAGSIWRPLWDPLLSANAHLAHDLHNGNAAYVDLSMRAFVGSMYEDRCGKE